MTTWKKGLIVALCVFGAAALLFAGLMCKVYYDKNYKIDYWYNVYIVNDRLFQAEVTSSGERLLYDTKGRYVGKSGI